MVLPVLRPGAEPTAGLARALTATAHQQGLLLQRLREGDLLVLDALSSLAYQSHANPDGFGLAAFCTDGKLSLVRRPVRAAGDEDFGHHARETHAATFLGHVRYADIGEISEANTHPVEHDGRACAHHGVAGYVRLRQGDVTWAPGSHDGADIEVPA